MLMADDVCISLTVMRGLAFLRIKRRECSLASSILAYYLAFVKENAVSWPYIRYRIGEGGEGSGFESGATPVATERNHGVASGVSNPHVPGGNRTHI